MQLLAQTEQHMVVDDEICGNRNNFWPRFAKVKQQTTARRNDEYCLGRYLGKKGSFQRNLEQNVQENENGYA